MMYVVPPIPWNTVEYRIPVFQYTCTFSSTAADTAINSMLLQYVYTCTGTRVRTDVLEYLSLAVPMGTNTRLPKPKTLRKVTPTLFRE